MFRPMFSPIFRSNLSVLTFCRPVTTVGRRSVHCTKAVYTVKLLLKMGENGARNMYGWFKRSINGSYCILLVTYTIVLMTHGHTNIKCNVLVLYWKEKYNDSVCMETFESPCSLCTWDGGNRFLRNVGTSHPNHTAAQLRLCTTSNKNLIRCNY
jgi:hypothetical protein